MINIGGQRCSQREVICKIWSHMHIIWIYLKLVVNTKNITKTHTARMGLDSLLKCGRCFLAFFHVGHRENLVKVKLDLLDLFSNLIQQIPPLWVFEWKKNHERGVVPLQMFLWTCHMGVQGPGGFGLAVIEADGCLCKINMLNRSILFGNIWCSSYGEPHLIVGGTPQRGLRDYPKHRSASPSAKM